MTKIEGGAGGLIWAHPSPWLTRQNVGPVKVKMLIGTNNWDVDNLQDTLS